MPPTGLGTRPFNTKWAARCLAVTANRWLWLLLSAANVSLLLLHHHRRHWLCCCGCCWPKHAALTHKNHTHCFPCCVIICPVTRFRHGLCILFTQPRSRAEPRCTSQIGGERAREKFRRTSECQMDKNEMVLARPMDGSLRNQVAPTKWAEWDGNRNMSFDSNVPNQSIAIRSKLIRFIVLHLAILFCSLQNSKWVSANRNQLNYTAQSNGMAPAASFWYFLAMFICILALGSLKTYHSGKIHFLRPETQSMVSYLDLLVFTFTIPTKSLTNRYWFSKLMVNFNNFDDQTTRSLFKMQYSMHKHIGRVGNGRRRTLRLKLFEKSLYNHLS